MESPQTSPCVRSRLLDAAERVVARDGVNNLTLSAVAAEAHVSKGGLLYHFPSKSSLIVGVVERLATHCEGMHAQACDANADAPGRFTRAYVTSRLDPIDPDEVAVHTALLAAAGTDPQYLEPFRRRQLEWQEKLAHDGIDPVDATIIRLAIDGLCLGSLLGMPAPDAELRKAVIDRLLAMTQLPDEQKKKS